jgi:hypothetical protein
LVTTGEAAALVGVSVGLGVVVTLALHHYGILQIAPPPATPIAPVSVNADGSGRGLNFFLENLDRVDPLAAFLQ